MEKFSLDLALREIGKFGRYQIFCYVLITFIVFLTGTYNVTFVFTAGELNYRCRVVQCDGETGNAFHTNWLRYAYPYDKDLQMPVHCTHYRYVGANGKIVNTCHEYDFDNRTQVKCATDFIYETEEKTILNEFDLQCNGNKWKLTLVGSVQNLGILLNLLISGYLCDKYGRLTMFVYSTLGAAIFGLGKSFAWNYWSFVVLEFLEPLFGSGTYATALILALELVKPQHRAVGGAVLFTAASAGKIFLGIEAMLLQDWRKILRVNFSPAFIVVFYFWLIPESMRWLLTKGRNAEVSAILLRIARINKIELSTAVRTFLEQKPNDITLSGSRNIRATSHEDFKTLFKYPGMIGRIVSCSFCWMTSILIYYGLTLKAVTIGGNKYTDFIIIQTMEIPACFFVMYAANKFGRKLLLSTALMVSGTVLLVFTFAYETHWVKLVIFMVGKFSMTVAFSTTYIYTSELFPTNMRSSLLAVCAAFGRIGSMIAPQAPLLEMLVTNLTIYLFSFTALLAALLCLRFPETLNTKLPDTIEEALAIDRAKCFK